MSEAQNKKIIGFQYGILSDSLEEQANSQGYTLEDQADSLEKYCTEIHDLWIGDILTDSQKDKAIERLHKKVLNSVKILAKSEEK